MALIGYARVSTQEQHLDLQLDALREAACDRIFEDEGYSAVSPNRPGFERAMNVLCKGDIFVVWKMDRAFRSLRNALDILEQFEARGIELRCLTEPIDTTTPMGKFFYQVRNSFAELERNYIRERTIAGMEAAKKRGVKIGRPRKLSSNQLVRAQERLTKSPNVTPIKALIYCRVSDTKQKVEGSGLKSQEYRCRQHAGEKSLIVEQVFHDDVSGGGDYSKRPGMMALLSHLENHPKTRYVVLFDDLKRLARDTMFHLQLRHIMASFGAEMVCPNYKFGNTPEDEFVETLFAAQGQLERKQIGRQTKQKTKARLEAGYYAFIAPVGYYYEKSKTGGKVLLVDEAVRGVLQEAMEGFASGRFQTKQEVRYFLENAPEFPKSASGKLGNSRTAIILSNQLYAGYIEYKPWGVTLRKGQHEGIISFEAFQKIQERLEGRAHAPARKDISLDFPLRGSVSCVCGNALTACWSKGRSGHHPYYLCQNKACEHNGKSIRRDVIEGEFEDLLKTLTPTHALFSVATDMFKALWNHRAANQQTLKKSLEQQGRSIDRKIEQHLDRIVDAESPLVMKAFEKRIDDLQNKKHVIAEKLSNCGRPIKPYDEMYRTAMEFLKNPHEIWACGRFEDKRAVLKLAFLDRLTYVRNEGYRTPDLSLPFKALSGFVIGKNDMVARDGIEPPTRGFSVLCSTD